LTVLNKKIEPQESDLTYETVIWDTLHDMKLADSVANRPWTVSPEIEKYFENMAEVNVWAETGLAINKELLAGAIEAGGGSGIGVDCILMLPDLCEAGIGLKLLDATFYRRALWHYFQSRESGFSPEQAFEDALVVDLFRNKYNNPETREYFESLWTEYGGPHISDDGGLKPDFKKQVINQLRTLLLSGFEKYKFEPYQIYRIKSPCEIQVYDSQGRAIGLVNGEVSEEIPNSAYDNESKTILIFNSTDLYYCRIVGSDNGTYGLSITSVENGTSQTFARTNVSISTNATHQYTINWSDHEATVRIDADGDGTFEQNVTLKQPVASFTYTPENPVVNQTITFNASSSYDPDGTIVSYEWDFGDGNVTSTTHEILNHSYSEAGSYEVTLTVTDNDGATNSTTKEITVYPPTAIFDTGAPSNPYPSIPGTHNGTITPNQTINVSMLYTYPCAGTGGHTEYARIWNSTLDVNATWNGYVDDWHNITFDKPVVLLPNKTYNYTIRTGSYPQIHHNTSLLTPNGWINCTKFIDANGKVYYNWIPAIMLRP